MHLSTSSADVLFKKRYFSTLNCYQYDLSKCQHKIPDDRNVISFAPNCSETFHLSSLADGGARCKVRGSAKSVGFILCGT